MTTQRLRSTIRCASLVGLFLVGAAAVQAQPNDSSLVGCWFTVFYNRSPFADPRPNSSYQWYRLWRDTLKTPVVGWGDDTLVGDYSSLAPAVLRRQIKAMKRAGIDFMIVDLTNGLVPIEPSYPKYEGDGLSTAALRLLFSVMDSLPPNDRVPIAVALGFEFWGRYSLCHYWRSWDGWDEQYRRQEHAIAQLRAYFNTPSYFRYQGRPLVIAYLDAGLDYPPRNDDGSARREWSHPAVTLRTAVAWRSTYTTMRTIGDDTCVPATSRMMAGMDSIRYWSWGQGAVDTADSWDHRPLSVKPEEMGIMPGTHLWMFDGDPEPIKRRRGDEEYYIRSWKQIIAAKPRIVTICDWNNWNEETAIEGSIGKNGWTDLRGNPTYDWYLKITRAYASVFKGTLLPETYVRQEGSDTVYRWDGVCLNELARDYKPAGEPIIELPSLWLQQNRYWIHCDQ
jgi:hypothetical protein